MEQTEGGSRSTVYLSAASLSEAGGISQESMPCLDQLSIRGHSQSLPSLAAGEWDSNSLLEMEVKDLRMRYEASLRMQVELRSLVREYEQSMREMMMVRPSAVVEGDELKLLRIAHQNLIIKHEESKALLEQQRMMETSLRSMLTSVQNDLITARQATEQTKRDFEQRMTDLQSHLQTITANGEAELSVLRARLHKADLRIASLEAALEAKTRENGELGQICDELIQKMDALK